VAHNRRKETTQPEKKNQNTEKSKHKKKAIKKPCSAD
jgi:hypothetical protein